MLRRTRSRALAADQPNGSPPRAKIFSAVIRPKSHRPNSDQVPPRRQRRVYKQKPRERG